MMIDTMSLLSCWRDEARDAMIYRLEVTSGEIHAMPRWQFALIRRTSLKHPLVSLVLRAVFTKGTL